MAARSGGSAAAAEGACLCAYVIVVESTNMFQPLMVSMKRFALVIRRLPTNACARTQYYVNCTATINLQKKKCFLVYMYSYCCKYHKLLAADTLVMLHCVPYAACRGCFRAVLDTGPFLRENPYGLIARIITFPNMQKTTLSI